MSSSSTSSSAAAAAWAAAAMSLTRPETSTSTKGNLKRSRNNETESESAEKIIIIMAAFKRRVALANMIVERSANIRALVSQAVKAIADGNPEDSHALQVLNQKDEYGDFENCNLLDDLTPGSRFTEYLSHFHHVYPNAFAEQSQIQREALIQELIASKKEW